MSLQFVKASTSDALTLNGIFLVTFAAVAVGMSLEGIGDKISELLAS